MFRPSCKGAASASQVTVADIPYTRPDVSLDSVGLDAPHRQRRCQLYRHRVRHHGINDRQTLLGEWSGNEPRRSNLDEHRRVAAPTAGQRASRWVARATCGHVHPRHGDGDGSRAPVGRHHADGRCRPAGSGHSQSTHTRPTKRLDQRPDRGGTTSSPCRSPTPSSYRRSRRYRTATLASTIPSKAYCRAVEKLKSCWTFLRRILTTPPSMPRPTPSRFP